MGGKTVYLFGHGEGNSYKDTPPLWVQLFILIISTNPIERQECSGKRLHSDNSSSM